MKVTKISGEVVDFNEDSLRRSLYKSGADKEDADRIFNLIRPKCYDLISTKVMYKMAFDELLKIKNSFAARYKLKRALKELGPDGFYFEKWISKVFQAQGFESVTGQTLTGQSGITHEIDVIANNKKDTLFCECKFRNDIDAKISVTTPMYFKSRFEDLKELNFEYFGKQITPTIGFMITNAYFTTDSIQFAKYYNVQLLAWDYPTEKGLKHLVDNLGLYPITTMTTLTTDEEKIMLSKNCILVKEIVQNPKLLDHFKFDDKRKNIILQEAKELVEYKEKVS